MKICSKTHQIATFQNKNSGKHVPEPPGKRMATLLVASPPPPQKKLVAPPLANPAYAHEIYTTLFI